MAHTVARMVARRAAVMVMAVARAANNRASHFCTILTFGLLSGLFSKSVFIFASILYVPRPRKVGGRFLKIKHNVFTVKQLFVLGALALSFFFAVIGCKKDSGTDYLNQADCTGINTDNNTYTKSIKAILDSRCATAGCHDAGKKEQGIDLSTYATSKSAFENKECLCSIHHGSGCNPMPQGGSKLDDATIKLIDCWGKNGYKE